MQAVRYDSSEQFVVCVEDGEESIVFRTYWGDFFFVDTQCGRVFARSTLLLPSTYCL